MIVCDTVEGKNLAPVDRWFIPFFIGFQPSKVVQDFFHPPYVLYTDVLRMTFQYSSGQFKIPGLLNCSITMENHHCSMGKIH